MAVEVRQGEFVKGTTTFEDKSEPLVEYFYVAFTQRESITDYGKPPKATLVWGDKTPETRGTSKWLVLEKEDYLGIEKTGGKVRIKDHHNVRSELGEIESTTIYEIPSEEEMQGMFFRTILGSLIQK